MEWLVEVIVPVVVVIGVLTPLWFKYCVRLEVKCEEGEDGRFQLSIFNNSAFPVRITEVGFILREGEQHGLQTLNHDGLIEARSDLKIGGTIDGITNLPDLAHGVKACYALRADRKLKTGPVSRALKVKLVEAGKAAGSS